MDPADPASFHHRTEVLPNGRTYHFIDQLPSEYDAGKTPTLLCLHGFPDFWYGWRYQIGPWVKHGWRVVVPDLLGYGGTEQPYDAKEYTFGSISADLASLLDLLEVERAVVVGHDWGAFTAWRFCQWQPKRVRAVATLSVPYIPRYDVYIPPTKMVERVPDFGYQLFLNEDESTAVIEEHLPAFFDALYRSPRTWIKGLTRRNVMEQMLRRHHIDKGDLLTETERAYYVQTFAKSGMRGPTNYYRTGRYRFDEEKQADLPKALPASLTALFFHPTADPTSPKSAVEAMKPLIPTLQIIPVPAGHWLMIEARDLITTEVAEWVDKVVGSQAKL